MEQANGGVDALEKLTRFQADLVLSDFRMPGMNGAELLSAVKRLQPRALRVILSGFADVRSILARSTRARSCRFLTKPWDDEPLVDLLRRLLSERDLLAELYLPFQTPMRGVTSQAMQQESKLVIRLDRADAPFTSEQLVALVSSFTGALEGRAFDVVGGLLAKHAGRVSFIAQVGAGQQLTLEVPVDPLEAPRLP